MALAAEENYRGFVDNPSEKLASWLAKVARVDFAFQPIVHPVTGVTFGAEALLRGYENLGFAHPHSFFDAAYADDTLFIVDIALREKVISRFRQIECHDKLVLFYNYDPRILEMPDYRPGMTERLMANFDLKNGQICFEINEQYPIDSHEMLKNFSRTMKERGIKIALDDFGSGFAGMELFYHADPGFLKFDRFLISGIENDSRKKNICSHLVALCRMQGVTTVAEGIESEAEFRVVKDIGFDLVQGYFVARPVTAAEEIYPAYEHIRVAAAERQRRRLDDVELIGREILAIETISIDDDVRVLLDKFHDQRSYNFFPVLDANGAPLGIVHETTIKQYVYSPYGRELLANKSVTKGISAFITPCPTTDINTPQDKILEIFLANPDSEGVMVVQNTRYFGFLNAKSLLTLIHEKSLALARDMNPLTRLPGNNVVHRFMSDAMERDETFCYFAYLDFDHFKPFNDRFGFRQGDRAIMLFADILRRLAPADFLIAHIGGDDFFLGRETNQRAADEVLRLADEIRLAFEHEVKPFFQPADRERGFYTSTNRENEVKEFPILSVSAAIIELKPGEKPEKPEDIAAFLASLKKSAKGSRDHLASAAFES